MGGDSGMGHLRLDLTGKRPWSSQPTCRLHMPTELARTLAKETPQEFPWHFQEGHPPALELKKHPGLSQLLHVALRKHGCYVGPGNLHDHLLGGILAVLRLPWDLCLMSLGILIPRALLKPDCGSLPVCQTPGGWRTSLLCEVFMLTGGQIPPPRIHIP